MTTDTEAEVLARRSERFVVKIPTPDLLKAHLADVARVLRRRQADVEAAERRVGFWETVISNVNRAILGTPKVMTSLDGTATDVNFHAGYYQRAIDRGTDMAARLAAAETITYDLRPYRAVIEAVLAYLPLEMAHDALRDEAKERTAPATPAEIEALAAAYDASNVAFHAMRVAMAPFLPPAPGKTLVVETTPPAPPPAVPRTPGTTRVLEK